jgi:hypothetical protein
MRRHPLSYGVLVLLVTGSVAFGQAPAFPDLIALPAGFGPEGIAVGNGHTFYVGSLTPPTLGEILVGDLRTGHVSILVPPTGRPALGLKYHARSGFLFVAGGPSGGGTVYDSASGAEVEFYQFQAAGTGFINDVVLMRDAAYFTDSLRAFLYRVPLGPRSAPAESFQQIPLPANFQLPGGCPVGPPIGGNGIAADPSGRFLILVHSSEGRLYQMDTATLTVVAIDLGGADVCSGDGLLLRGKTLYVVQNFLNRVAVVELSPDNLSGTLTRYITEPFTSNPAVKVPTTIADFGSSLYAVTAGFAPPAPDFVVRLRK